MSIVRSSLRISVFGASWVLLASCSGSSPDDPIVIASGGTTVVAQGGSTNTGNGGVTSTGGTRTSGGSGVGGATGGAAQNNGGSSGSGGTTSTGGRTATGGATLNGGTTNGGTTQTGGARTTGGTPIGGSSLGGAATGGRTTGGAPMGGSSLGGAATGGRTTGGASMGGSAVGGAATGGRATGGAATGGAATGGAATGGAATGGAATGGRATGGAATGGAATGGSNSGTSVPPLTNGASGITTRYWDCCMPSCSWRENATADGKSSPSTVCAKDGSTVVAQTVGSACSGGSGYQCNWGAPWQVGSNLSYGYAAHNGGNCGKCYQLDFTGSGDNAGARTLAGKIMIVQVVNTGGIAANQFDLLIPGGGVGANNACTGSGKQWGDVPGGATYGGFLTTCGTSTSCVTSMCTAAFGSNTSLMAGCNWFVGWFAAASNPSVRYAEVTCPAELTNKSSLK